MAISNSVSAMVEELELALVDAEKADKGNKAAGTRVRKVMQSVTAKAKEIRKDVLEARK